MSRAAPARGRQAAVKRQLAQQGRKAPPARQPPKPQSGKQAPKPPPKQAPQPRPTLQRQPSKQVKRQPSKQELQRQPSKQVQQAPQRQAKQPPAPQQKLQKQTKQVRQKLLQLPSSSEEGPPRSPTSPPSEEQVSAVSMRLRAVAVATPQRRTSWKRPTPAAVVVADPAPARPAKRANVLGKVATSTGVGAKESAIEAAIRSHAELLQGFGKKGNSASIQWRDSCEMAEARVEERFPELLGLFAALLPESGAELLQEEHAGAQAYSVYQVQGQRVVDDSESELSLGEQLERLRSASATGAARDALCALLAALASRREMCWLEAYDTESPVRGYFAHSLANPKSTLRFTTVRTVSSPVLPTSLIVSSLQPLRAALEHMDNGGPLKELPANVWASSSPDGLAGAAEEVGLALQELENSESLGAYGTLPEERAIARWMEAEPNLKELLLSSREVLTVEVYVSLAPRSVASAEGLSEVIRHELVQLLQRAKAEGRAVVLQLGGNNPHLLARKVYLRPEFTQFGLRCGYLRWRAGPQAPWGREQPWQNRACIGLQLP